MGGELWVGIAIGLAIGFACGRLLGSRRATPTLQAEHVGETPLLDQMLGSPDNAGTGTHDTAHAQTLADLRQNLLVKLLHDETKVTRAIEFERSRTPEASELELLKSAIYRWERDNH